MSFLQMPNPIAARSLVIGRSGVVLSGVAAAQLVGKHALAADAGEATAAGAQILNTALGAQGRLLLKPTPDLAPYLTTSEVVLKQHSDPC